MSLGMQDKRAWIGRVAYHENQITTRKRKSAWKAMHMHIRTCIICCGSATVLALYQSLHAMMKSLRAALMSDRKAIRKCMEAQTDKTQFKARNQIQLNQRGIQASHVLLTHRFSNALLQSRRRWPSSCADKCFHSKHMLIIICFNTASVTCALVVFADQLAKVEQSTSE